MENKEKTLEQLATTQLKVQQNAPFVWPKMPWKTKKQASIRVRTGGSSLRNNL